ncbi:MAG: hypothetical protein ACE5GL_09405, partial [Calditrichia bacterium]
FAGREKFAGFVIGLLPLVRHEGIALAGIWFVYMLYRKRWSEGILAFTPVLFYNLISILLLSAWPFEIYADYEPMRIYGQGSWFHFFPRIAIKVGLPLSLLSLFALKPLWRLKEKSYFMIGYAGYFLTHVIIYGFGLFASTGYSIYLLPLAPGFAIAAALGAEQVLDWLPGKLNRLAGAEIRKQRLKIGLIGFYGFCVLFSGLLSRPYAIDRDGLVMKEVSEWIQSNGFSQHDIVATHVWFYYLFNLKWTPQRLWDHPPRITDLAPGTLLVWDGKYSNHWGLRIEELSDPKNGWERLREFGDGFAILFRKPPAVSQSPFFKQSDN